MDYRLYSDFMDVPDGLSHHFKEACVDAYKALKIDDKQCICPNCLKPVPEEFDEQHHYFSVFDGEHSYTCEKFSGVKVTFELKQ
jgi:hypothetical protein